MAKVIFCCKVKYFLNQIFLLQNPHIVKSSKVYSMVAFAGMLVHGNLQDIYEDWKRFLDYSFQ